MKAIAKFGRSKLGKGLGRALVVTGFALNTLSKIVDGDDPFTAAGKATVVTAVSLLGAGIGAELGMLCMEFAVICVPAFSVAGAYLGGEVGELANKYILEPLGVWDTTAAAWDKAEPYVDRGIAFVSNRVDQAVDKFLEVRHDPSKLLPWRRWTR